MPLVDAQYQENTFLGNGIVNGPIERYLRSSCQLFKYELEYNGEILNQLSGIYDKFRSILTPQVTTCFASMVEPGLAGEMIMCY